MNRLAYALFASLALLAGARAAGAAPQTAPQPVLAADTTVRAWTLPNGLMARVLNVPGASTIAITMAYRAGNGIDPADRPGLAGLLSALQFFGPAGEIPARTPVEMASLRPAGWEQQTDAHLSVLTELASREQFPGTLRQVARRAHGVTVDDSTLARMVRQMSRDVAGSIFGAPSKALGERIDAHDRGLTDAKEFERTTGKPFAGLSPAAAESLLHRYYVPANAAIALAGDFKGMNIEALVNNEFGDIPAGASQPDPPTRTIAPGVHTAVLPGLKGSVAVMGITAPALDDSLHPMFYLNALLLGTWWKSRHDADRQQLSTLFDYSVLAQPEQAHFYFDLKPGVTDPRTLPELWNNEMDTFADLMILGEDHVAMASRVAWILGAPLPREVREQAARTPAMLRFVSSSAAARAAWRGDAFWARYRDRVETAHFGSTAFLEWMKDPRNQVMLLLHAPQ